MSSSLSYSGIPWYAEYYNSSDFTNGPIYTTTYSPSGLNLNWGEGSPGGSVTVDNFTARFTRSLTVPTDLAQGVYTFYARADDNFRFYVDSTLVMDHWDAFAADQTYTADVTLLTGGHTLKFEYREQTSGAYVFLTWTPPYAQNPILDPSGGTSIVSGTTGSTAAGITATVNVSVLNFRNAPNATAQIISKLSKGAVYAASGRNGDNTWVQIVVDSTSGWVVAQYVTLSGDINVLPIVTPTVSPTAVPAVPQPIGVRGKVYGNLRIREQPTTSAKQIGLMPWGSEMDLLGINEGRSWYMVSYDGLVGWAYAPWIRIIEGSFDQLPYTDGTQPVYEPPPATQGVIAQAYGNMRIRSGPSLSATKIARAVWGTRVEVLARSTNLLWYKVRYGDVVGWTYAAWYRIVQGDVSTLPASNE